MLRNFDAVGKVTDVSSGAWVPMRVLAEDMTAALGEMGVHCRIVFSDVAVSLKGNGVTTSGARARCFGAVSCWGDQRRMGPEVRIEGRNQRHGERREKSCRAEGRAVTCGSARFTHFDDN
jgi:hypothetical protein